MYSKRERKSKGCIAKARERVKCEREETSKRERKSKECICERERDKQEREKE